MGTSQESARFIASSYAKPTADSLGIGGLSGFTTLAAFRPPALRASLKSHPKAPSKCLGCPPASAMIRAMRKRTWIVLAVLCLVLVAGVIGYRAMTARDVELGMTEAEVHDILGDKSITVKFNNAADFKSFAHALMEKDVPAAVTLKRWDGRQASVHVFFDANGRVAAFYYPRGSGRWLRNMLRAIGLD